MKVRATLRCLSALAMWGLATTSCDQGKFPGFLEPLDVVDPANGDVASWIEARDDSSQIVVISSDGQYLRSIVYRDTSVDVEVGDFVVQGDQMHYHGSARFSFPSGVRFGQRPARRPPGGASSGGGLENGAE